MMMKSEEHEKNQKIVFWVSIALIPFSIGFWIASLIVTTRGNFDGGIITLPIALMAGVVGIFAAKVGGDERKYQFTRVHHILLWLAHVGIVVNYMVLVLEHTDDSLIYFSLIAAVFWGLTGAFTIKYAIRYRDGFDTGAYAQMEDEPDNEEDDINDDEHALERENEDERERVY